MRVALGLAILLPMQVIVYAEELLQDEPISPIPLETKLDSRKVTLGRGLFSDNRLSDGNGVSCATCHLRQFAYTDGVTVSRGLPGEPGYTNALTILNVGLNTKFGWSGQTYDLQHQVDAVVQRKSTMGANWNNVIATLRRDEALTSAFNSVYNDGLNRKNVIDAIVEYEKSLNTPDAPFDQYLRGNKDAISEDAKTGYRLFKNYGCVSCHQGVNVGGNMLQVFGIFGNSERAAMGAQTPGSAKNTGIDEERAVFRVPSLRNVAATAPYFHDGSVSRLSEAISIMAEEQLGRQVPEAEVRQIQAFLESLTGKLNGIPVGK